MLDDLLLSLPHLQTRSALSGLWLLLVALVLWNGASAIGYQRALLARDGVLPRALTVTQGTLRLLAAFALFSASAGLAPQLTTWVVPLAVVGGALGLGFVVTQDVAPDLIAGLVLTVQQRVHPGQWLQGDGYLGTVESLGFTALWLRDPQGRRIAIPNRTLLHSVARTDPSPHPLVQLTLRISPKQEPETIREALHQIVLCSPWLAPSPHIQVHNDALNASHWHVRARVLQIDHQERFIQATTDAAHHLIG